MTPSGTHVVVVGGGIAGLAAAWSLSRERGVSRVTVLEAAARVGGKLALATVEGLPVDTGAEVVLTERPEAVSLIDDVGLGGGLVAAQAGPTAVVVDGSLRPLPSSTLSGIPTDPSDVARSQLLDAAALARLPLDHVLPRTELGDDIGVGRLVAERLGTQVVERLLSPVLGAVHAGPVRDLSLRATMPALFEAMRHERSMMVAAAGVSRSAQNAYGPRYLGVAGGLGRLPDALEARLRSAGAVVRTGAVVRGLSHGPSGWRLDVGPVGAADVIDADGVLLAVPAAPASRLLRDAALGASVHLDGIRSASVATVVLAYRRADLTSPSGGLGLDQLPGAEVLVPPDAGRPTTALTVPSLRWSWLADRADARQLVVVRISLGRLGEEYVLQRDDEELAALAHHELAFVLRTGRARPVASAVTRWGGALPQYEVGHVDRIAAVRESVAAQPALAVCGAAYDGTGVTACIVSGQRAAATVAAQVRASARAAR